MDVVGIQSNFQMVVLSTNTILNYCNEDTVYCDVYVQDITITTTTTGIRSTCTKIYHTLYGSNLWLILTTDVVVYRITVHVTYTLFCISRPLASVYQVASDLRSVWNWLMTSLPSPSLCKTIHYHKIIYLREIHRLFSHFVNK